jgi:transposase
MGNLINTATIGIDVAKDELVIFFDGDQSTVSIANNQSAILELTTDWQKFPKLSRIVVEASGGYETLVVSLLANLGLPVALVNPKRVRDFAKGVGRLAKTDRLDAATLAAFGELTAARLYRLPGAEQTRLAELVARRSQLVQMKAVEQTRFKQTAEAVKPSIKRHLDWLEAEIRSIDTDLSEQITSHPVFKELDERLQSVPGIGPTVSATLIAELPELGTISAKQLAALVGVAPFAFESGRYRGQRRISGGRRAVRKSLYLATIAAVRCNQRIKMFYQRLKEQGKPTKVAIIACARKMLTFLNAMVRDCKLWSPVSI